MVRWPAAPQHPGASVTSRALALLGAFDEKHRRLTLTELAARAGLPVPTAHRLVAELVEWGALARTADGRYVVGRRLWDLGLLAPVQTGLRQLASPYLHDLYGATLATVHLAVRDGLEVLYVDRLRRARVGAGGEPDRLAAADPRDRGRQGAARARPGRTSRRGVLGATLARHHAVHDHPAGHRCAASWPRCVRDDYATTVEEMTLGACSVAVPIRAATTWWPRSGIVLPTPRASDRPRLVAALQVAARGIGRIT